MFDHFSTFCMIRLRSLHLGLTNYTAQKVKFSIKYFFSKWDQIHSKLQIWSHLLKKYLMENFSAVLRVRISMSTLPKYFQYLEYFWSAFSHIWTEYGDLLCKSPYSVQMEENAGQKNSEYGQFPRSDTKPNFGTEHWETYSKPKHISKIKLLAEIVSNFKLTIFQKKLHRRCLTRFRHNNETKLTKKIVNSKDSLDIFVHVPWKNPWEINRLQNLDIDFA